MEVAMPTSGNAIDCYEDMFKEITRKLYGEDGLPELGTIDRHINGPQDRGLTPIDYDVETPLLKSEEHITAFGLAALMQNGFTPASILNPPFQQNKPNSNYEDKWIISEENLQWTQSKIASYNPMQKLFRCAECDCVGYLPRVVEHWLGTHSNLRVFQCSQCPYESAWIKCVRTHLTRQHNINSDDTIDALLKNNPVLQEITRYLQQLKNRIENNYSKPQQNTQNLEDYQNVSNIVNNSNNRTTTTQTLTNNETTSNSNKRYSCSFCPYATDRRDLFTRHENIHREEKPFQCYVCQKQFNRADHVKKHFLRMHREHPYDLNRIRRHPPKNASGMSYYQKYNATGTQETTDHNNSTGNLNNNNNSLTIPNGFGNITRTVQNNRLSHTADLKNSIKSNSLLKSSSKKKGEKRFTCCYCSWSGVDNWCLKRHMNTHLKPFVCGLCDYKAARSERLATHVLKVHNKRACSKCNYLADDPAQLTIHQQEHHPSDQRNHRNNSNVLRNNSYSNNTVASTSTSLGQSQTAKAHELSSAAALLQHGNRLLQPESKPWKPHAPKQHGAARLFNYMEASDGSEPECDSRGTEDMSRINLSHRIQSDFPEAGDVGSPLDDEEGEEMELPLFVCPVCGCEFEDDGSLETHQHTHRHNTTSPAKAEDCKENINPKYNYKCQICNATFINQNLVMAHMSTHSTVAYSSSACQNSMQRENKRSRKQSQPKKVLSLFWDNDNMRLLRQNEVDSTSVHLVDKYMAQLITRKGYTCNLCKPSRISQFQKKGSLVLHKYWRHSKKSNFQCEHCSLLFKHRYQVVLHSSRAHVRNNRCSNDKNQTVPTIKEPNHSIVPVPDDSHNFLTNYLATTVPDITNSSTANVHKLGMSFFEHTFLHSNTSINSHMPIIIPTFPPN